MLCYHCGQNEADNKIFVNYMGRMGEVNICNECMEKMQRYMSGMYRRYRQSMGTNGGMQFSPPFQHMEQNRPEGGIFPADAGEEIRCRRRLGELRAQLRTAVRREDYEKAAALRDEIARVERIRSEKGVMI